MYKENRIWAVTLIGTWFTCLCWGCHTGPSYQEDSGYRVIERDVQRTGTELALTGADIAAGVKNAGNQAEQVQETLKGIEVAIKETSMADTEKKDLLRQVFQAQGEALTLNDRLDEVTEDVERLNSLLAEQRQLNETLSTEYDKRESTEATVKAELAKVRGQRNLYLAMLIAVCLGVLGYIAFRILRVLPV
jgi:chromosome segregation ATPase